jgi:AbiU2
MPSTFSSELAIFHEEQEIAQRYFFGYLAIREKAAEDKELLGVINRNPRFWTTVDHGLVLAMFVALGRIFDQKSSHNIDKLLKAVNVKEFSRAALEARLLASGRSAEEVAAPVKHAHELTDKEVRELRKKVAHWRRIYEKNYRDIRRKFFAHREVSGLDEIKALFAKTKVEELKRLFHFLNSFYLALFAAYANGVAINLDSYNALGFGGEQVRVEGERVLKLMVKGRGDAKKDFRGENAGGRNAHRRIASHPLRLRFANSHRQRPSCALLASARR